MTDTSKNRTKTLVRKNNSCGNVDSRVDGY